MKKLLKYNTEMELSVKFNIGLHERMINLYAVYDNLGEEIVSGNMFFGCDSKTAFLRKAKIFFSGYPRRAILSEAFKTLSWCRMSLSSSILLGSMSTYGLELFGSYHPLRLLFICMLSAVFSKQDIFGQHIVTRTISICL